MTYMPDKLWKLILDLGNTSLTTFLLNHLKFVCIWRNACFLCLFLTKQFMCKCGRLLLDEDGKCYSRVTSWASPGISNAQYMYVKHWVWIAIHLLESYSHPMFICPHQKKSIGHLFKLVHRPIFMLTYLVMVQIMTNEELGEDSWVNKA